MRRLTCNITAELIYIQNDHVVIITYEESKCVFEKRLGKDLSLILSLLSLYWEMFHGVVGWPMACKHKDAA